ncbi:hypothetical protein CHS0354_001419 [Potamilus streckersoni]|uniref:Uncharacterized protein n=1 Tax=Potamilus streckersoni TaxID=2493646 RepID=A0AAE0T805_9BIVA|nr:hypothetical protein CHS0354_001419 [Potamilus streckersoni]
MLERKHPQSGLTLDMETGPGRSGNIKTPLSLTLDIKIGPGRVKMQSGNTKTPLGLTLGMEIVPGGVKNARVEILKCHQALHLIWRFGQMD